MPVEITCQTCGIKKLFPPSIAKTRQYCKSSCRPLYGENNGNRKGGLIERSCNVCRSKLKVKQKTIKAGGGKYCSKECRASGVGRTNSEARKKINTPNCLCIVCSKKFYLKSSAIKSGQGSYCSKLCMSKDYSARLSGQANPNYKDGRASVQSYYLNMRRSAEGSYTKEDIEFLFSTQRGKCVNCLKGISDGYHIDHIYPVSKGGTNYPSNLQLLCAQCNYKKSAKDPIDWAQQNGRLL